MHPRYKKLDILYGWRWTSKISRVHKYPYTCNPIDVVNLKALEIGKWRYYKNRLF
jgi:hypothetical protein